MGMGGQRLAPAALPPGKTRYPLHRVGPRAGLDGCVKSRPPPGFDPWTFQPVASHSLQLRLEATIGATFTLGTKTIIVSVVITLVIVVTSGLTITMVTGRRRKFFAQRTCSDL